MHSTNYCSGWSICQTTKKLFTPVTKFSNMKRIEINQKKLGGKPVIRGTRIPVYLILEMLAAGMSVEDILKEYPELTKEDVREAIQYASQVLKSEEIHEILA